MLFVKWREVIFKGKYGRNIDWYSKWTYGSQTLIAYNLCIVVSLKIAWLLEVVSHNTSVSWCFYFEKIKSIAYDTKKQSERTPLTNNKTNQNNYWPKVSLIFSTGHRKLNIYKVENKTSLYWDVETAKYWKILCVWMMATSLVCKRTSSSSECFW